jgi:YegS/Rv2252/BmrU family lipid kinase
VARRLAAQGWTVEAVATTGPGSAAAQVKAALAAGWRTIAVLGGDGTLHDVVNGFIVDGRAAHGDARLAILQAGTGGDFARTLGLPRDPLAGADQLASARPFAVDVGVLRCPGLDGQPRTEAFLNVANVGLAAEVVERVNASSKAWGGFISFLLGSVAGILGNRPIALTLQGDDAPPVTGRFRLVSFCNGKYFGGGMAIGPNADPADGQLDVVTLGDTSRARLLASLPRVYAGKHLGLAGVTSRRCRTIQVTGPEGGWVEADGELIGRTPLQVDVLPAALTLLL